MVVVLVPGVVVLASVKTRKRKAEGEVNSSSDKGRVAEITRTEEARVREGVEQ